MYIIIKHLLCSPLGLIIQRVGIKERWFGAGFIMRFDKNLLQFKSGKHTAYCKVICLGKDCCTNFVIKL